MRLYGLPGCICLNVALDAPITECESVLAPRMSVFKAKDSAVLNTKLRAGRQSLLM